TVATPCSFQNPNLNLITSSYSYQVARFRTTSAAIPASDSVIRHFLTRLPSSIPTPSPKLPLSETPPPSALHTSPESGQITPKFRPARTKPAAPPPLHPAPERCDCE